MPFAFYPKYLLPVIVCLFISTGLLAMDYRLMERDTTEVDTIEIDTTEVNITEVDTTEVDTLLPDTTAVQPKEVMLFWTKKNSVGVNMNETAFVNWNAGGNNSISALFHANFERIYKKELLSWRTDGAIRYGLNAQEGRELRKTEDLIRFNSTAGYRRDSTSNFRYSAKFNFNTQVAYGFRYPDTGTPISKFMAPAYLFLGIGTEYSHPEEDFTVYVSPLTQKNTFVLDRRMSNQGRFGVAPAVRDEEGNIIEEGERIRTEIGILVTNGFTREIFDNVNLSNQLSLYTDYLHNFGNIDIDWEVVVDMVVNDFIKASIGVHIRYDDDVKVREDITGDGNLETIGPKIQLKQMLGIGVVYNF